MWPGPKFRGCFLNGTVRAFLLHLVPPSLLALCQRNSPWLGFTAWNSFTGLLIPALFFARCTWWGGVRQAVGPILRSAQGVQQELCVPVSEPGQTP